jgi:hypothetical protein
LGCTTEEENIPYGYVLQLLLQGHQGLFLSLQESLYFAVRKMKARKSTAQEAGGTRDSGLGDTTVVDVETHLQKFRSGLSIYSSVPELSGSPEHKVPD